MSVQIRFERYTYENGPRDIAEERTLGPFDWIEQEGRFLTAECGDERHEDFAVFRAATVDVPGWFLNDESRWDYFCISAA